MFDLMYEEYYDSRTRRVERAKLTPEDVIRLINENNRNDLYDLNLIYKRQTKTGLLAVRLYSFLVDKKDKAAGTQVMGVNGPVKERIVKFQFETGKYDQARPQGSRLISQMKFNMDIEEFAYFCEIMKSGKIMTLIKQKESDAKARGKQYADKAYSTFTEKNGVQRYFNVYRGMSSDICIETTQSQQGGNQVKIINGLGLNEAIKLGAMGSLAIDTLNMWYANGKAEENLTLINTRPKKDQGNTAESHGVQPGGAGYLKQSSGYATQGSSRDYGCQSGYAAQGNMSQQGSYIW